MSSDPGRLTYTNFSLADLVGLAYRVQRQQIVGPDWIDQNRFDILAKFAEGASRAQLPEMWQALLKDRFQLTLHMEKKELPVYALVAAKNGPKLQPAEKSTGLSI